MSAPSRIRPAFAAVLLLLAGILPALVAAEHGSPVDGSGGPAGYYGIPMGEDVAFTPTEWFNFHYVGTNEGTAAESCEVFVTRRDDAGLCRAADALAETYVRLTNPGTRAEEAARAGVGMGYGVTKGCVGQPEPATLPLWVNVSYRIDGYAEATRWDPLTERDVVTGDASVQLWFDPVDGRSTLASESGTGVPPHERVRAWGPTEGSFSAAGRIDRRVAAVEFFDTKAVLLYARAHAATALEAEARADLRVSRITFEFEDPTPPWVEERVESLQGGSLAPSATVGWTRWYQEPFQAVFQGRDDFSCPIRLNVTLAGATSSIDPGYRNVPLVSPVTTDGFYLFRAIVTNGKRVDGAPLDLRVGLDRVAPVPTLTLQGGTPGENGWHVGATPPRLRLACADATSGCASARWSHDGGLSWGAPVPGFPQEQVVQPGARSVLCEVTDRAALRNASCGATTRYDPAAPTGAAFCGPDARGISSPCPGAPGPAAWAAQPQQVRLTCQDADSGCWWLNHTVDQGAWSAAQDATETTFLLDEEGVHEVLVRRTDRAGNAVDQTAFVSVDLTPPATPQLLPGFSGGLVNFAPSWTATSFDNVSGVRNYSTFVNGQAVPNLGGVVNSSALPDGLHCASAIAYDHAGHASEPSTESCVYVDRRAPLVTLDAPRPGVVLRHGEEAYAAPAGGIVALGRVPLWSNASDDATSWASGLARHWTTLDGAAWTPLEGTSECALGASCARTFVPQVGQFGVHRFRAHAQDAAGNAAEALRKVDVVDALAHSGSTPAAAPYAEVEWLTHAGPGFVRYEVHRGQDANFAPSVLTQLAGSTNPATDGFRDKTVVPDATHYYKVRTVTLVNGVESHHDSVAYPAKIPPAGQANVPPTVILRPAYVSG